MPELSKDRREYFRIQDTLALDYRLLSDSLDPEDPDFPFQRSASAFGLIDKIQQTEADGQTLLRLIHDENRKVAGYLKNLDRRIQLLSQMLLANNPEIQALEHYPASLSEGGLAFVSHAPISDGQFLALKILLLPEHVGLFACARCVASRPHADGWEHALSFTAITETDQKLLARHIIKVQAYERREALRAQQEEEEE